MDGEEIGSQADTGFCVGPLAKRTPANRARRPGSVLLKSLGLSVRSFDLKNCESLFCN